MSACGYTSSRVHQEEAIMVKIRLTIIGKMKAPYYKIVVSDSRNPVDGRFIEETL